MVQMMSSTTKIYNMKTYVEQENDFEELISHTHSMCVSPLMLQDLGSQAKM